MEYLLGAVSLCIDPFACSAIDFSSLTQFLVVNLLDATTRGQVILGRCQLDAAVIGKFARTLYQTLAIGVATNDHSTVEVLQSTRHDFSSTCRVVIHQYSQWDVKIKRVVFGAVREIRCHHLTLGLHNLHVLGHEEVDHINSFVQQTTTIVAQIEDDLLCSLLLQRNDCLAHILGTSFRKLSQEDITSIAHQPIIGNSGQFDASTGNLEVTRLLLAWTLHLQHERRTRFTTQQFTHFCGVHALQVFVVNLQQHVTHLQTHLSGRHIRIRFLNDDRRVLPHTDDGTNTTIFTCGHHL